MKTRGMLVFLVVLATGLLTISPASPNSLDKLGTSGTICAGSAIYVVCVEDTPGLSGIGRYTARTGPSHPVPNRNVLYNGEFSSPGTTFNSYRSFTSGTTYTQGTVGGGVGGGTDLDPFATTEAIGTTGVRTIWDIPEPDRLRIVQDVNVNGTTLQNSNIEVTTHITNAGDVPLQVGVRYQWDWQIGEDDGLTFQERSPNGPVRTQEAEFAPPGFVFYQTQDNDFDDPTSPLYTIFGSATGPTTVNPPPVAPTQLTYGCWPDAFVTEFDYSIVPGRDVATMASPCRGFAGGDNSVLYWWGRSAENAIPLASGDSTTVRALLFAGEPDEPPPFDVTAPSCRIIRLSAGGIIVRIQDTESGLRQITVSDTQNAIVTVAPFTQGTNAPVDVRARRADSSQPGRFKIAAEDMSGNVTRCTTTGTIYV